MEANRLSVSGVEHGGELERHRDEDEEPDGGDVDDPRSRKEQRVINSVRIAAPGPDDVQGPRDVPWLRRSQRLATASAEPAIA